MGNNYKSTLWACYIGYITQAVNNNLAPLLFIVFQTSYQISYEMLGRLVLINFGTQIFVDWIALHNVDKIGYRRAAVIAHLFSAVGLACLGILPMLLPNPYTGLVIAVVIYAIGGGIIEVIISPIVDSLPGDAKASAMSLLHSFYCWGQMGAVIITTVILKVIGMDLWFILPVLWALLPLWNLFRFLKVPLMPPIAEHERIPLRKLMKSRFFVIALLLMMAAGASELTMSQWSSLFAEQGLKVPKLLGDLLGPCLFAFFMGIGRTIYGFWGHKIHLKNAMLATAILCIACYSATIFIPIPAFSLLGLALCGFSVSLMWPGTFSLTSGAFPKGGTAMFGLLAVFGDVGGAIGPWLAGLVSDITQKSVPFMQLATQWALLPEQFGLKAGLLAGIIFPILMTLGLLFLKDKPPAENPI